VPTNKYRDVSHVRVHCHPEMVNIFANEITVGLNPSLVFIIVCFYLDLNNIYATILYMFRPRCATFLSNRQ